MKDSWATILQILAAAGTVVLFFSETAQASPQMVNMSGTAQTISPSGLTTTISLEARIPVEVFGITASITTTPVGQLSSPTIRAAPPTLSDGGSISTAANTVIPVLVNNALGSTMENNPFVLGLSDGTEIDMRGFIPN